MVYFTDDTNGILEGKTMGLNFIRVYSAPTSSICSISHVLTLIHPSLAGTYVFVPIPSRSAFSPSFYLVVLRTDISHPKASSNNHYHTSD